MTTFLQTPHTILGGFRSDQTNYLVDSVGSQCQQVVQDECSQETRGPGKEYSNLLSSIVGRKRSEFLRKIWNEHINVLRIVHLSSRTLMPLRACAIRRETQIIVPERFDTAREAANGWLIENQSEGNVNDKGLSQLECSPGRQN